MKKFFTYLLLTTVAIACNVEMPQKPVSRFSFLPANGCKAPCTVQFTSEAINAKSIQWDFGDGSDLQSGDHIKHEFKEAKTYQVKLIVNGVEGGSSGSMRAVDIDAIGPFNFTGGFNFPTDITADPDGNIYVSGVARGTVKIADGFTINTVNGSDDFFVAKFNSAGQCQWVYTDGSPDNDHVNALALDVNNDVYITGFVAGKVTKSEMSSRGQLEGFVAKIKGSDGEAKWFNTFGGPLNDQGRSLTFYKAGEGSVIYLAGQVQGDDLKRDILFNGVYNHKTADTDGFFAIVNALTGDFRQVSIMGGKGDQIAESIDVDEQGNAFIAGKFLETVAVPGMETLTSIANSDIFVAKYGRIAKGFQWVRRLASVGDDYVGDIVVNNSEEVFVTGMHNDSFDEFPLRSSGDENVFIAKWNTNGDPLMAQNGFADHERDYDGGIAITERGTIVLAGSYSGNGWFPMSTSQKKMFQGGTDILVTELDSRTLEQTGDLMVREGGVLEDRVNAICVTRSGYVYVTGWSEGSPTYRGVTLNGDKELLQTFVVRYKL